MRKRKNKNDLNLTIFSRAIKLVKLDREEAITTRGGLILALTSAIPLLTGVTYGTYKGYKCTPGEVFEYSRMGLEERVRRALNGSPQITFRDRFIYGATRAFPLGLVVGLFIDGLLYGALLAVKHGYAKKSHS